MASLVDSSGSTACSCERGTVVFPLPTDLHKHVVLAGILEGHPQDLDGVTLPKRRGCVAATHLAWKGVDLRAPVLDSELLDPTKGRSAARTNGNV